MSDMKEFEVSDFTSLVLARMETNPEEFHLHNRWDTMVRALEAHAAGDMDSRYAKTLWALPEGEINMLLAKYRKVYLARMHKDLLKNIVSGDDLHKVSTLDNDVNPLKGHVLRGNSPLTTADIQTQTLAMLNQSFDTEYAKGEGAQITASPTMTYKATNRYVLNSSQIATCKKLGMDPAEYVKHVERFQG